MRAERETGQGREDSGGFILAVVLCVSAALWLISRVVVGLDFTDEMQYYGEIASLVRNGKFFHDDLFLQQLGYLFVWPVFKAHAIAFPDLRYLVLFGRLVFLGCYVAVAAVLWRATRDGGFSRGQRVLALATFLAWIPFQLFALSYNSIAYLLVVTLLAVRTRASAVVLATLLTVLTYAYPPAGLAMIVLGACDQWRLHGHWQAAGRLLGLTLGGGIVVLLILRICHGADFFADLFLAITFSRGFTGGAIFQWDALLTALLLAGCGVMAAFAVRKPADGMTWPAPRRQFLGVAACVAAAALLAGAVVLPNGYLPAAGLLALTVGFALTLRDASSSAHRTLLLVATAALLGISARWASGHFAATAYVVLLALVAGSPRHRFDRSVADLAITGTVLGTIVSFTSGNGVHNFGIGIAGCLPFLVLHASRAVPDWAPSRWLARSMMPALVVMAIGGNAALYPYREQRIGQRFERMRGVPAFAGLWTSPLKVETVAAFQQLFQAADLRGRTLLVVGPHPWIYFAAEARPFTPMFFMHFSVDEAIYDRVATMLFRNGEPDAVLLTNAIPSSIHASLNTWVAAGCTARTMTLPPNLIHRYWGQVRQPLGNEITLLTRTASSAARP